MKETSQQIDTNLAMQDQKKVQDQHEQPEYKEKENVNIPINEQNRNAPQGVPMPMGVAAPQQAEIEIPQYVPLDNDTFQQEKDSLGLSGQARGGFIRKVYGILSALLLLTVIMCQLSMTNEKIKNFQRNQQWLLYVCFGTYPIIFFVIFCFKNVARTVPTNYILLFFFTISLAQLVSCICAYYEPKIVLFAAILTLVCTVVLTIYACQSKDGGIDQCQFVCIAAPILLVNAIIFMFIQKESDYIWIGLLLVVVILVYGVQIVWDTEAIVGNGYCGIRFTIDDYIVAAMILFLDIIRLFLEILRVLGSKK